MRVSNIAIIYGGPSREHDVSLMTAESLRDALADGYRVKNIFIDRNGDWHVDGMMRDYHKALIGVDLVVNALHGTYGEDGTVQTLLDNIHMPYTGSRAYPSLQAMNKGVGKEIYKKSGLLTPHSKVLWAHKTHDAELMATWRELFPPVVVKPVGEGSSYGVTIARSFDEFKRACEETFQISPSIIVERFIKGREVTCGVIDNFRGEDTYILPPVEIRHGNDLFDYNSKYSGETHEVCPAELSREEKDKVQHMAKQAHHALGLRHYSRTDMILSPNGLYVLETNSLPGLSKHSLFPKSLHAIGSSIKEFAHHLVNHHDK